MGHGRQPQELFKLVTDYEALGDHRTGSAVDMETADWFAEHLELAGMSVSRETVNFTGWHCDASVRIDRHEIACLPVPYEWQGTIDTDRVAVIDLDPGLGVDLSVINEPVARAREAGFEAAVCATRHPNGLLRAINRPVHATATNFPVFLVAGQHLATLTAGDVHVRASAEAMPSTTTNVFAHNGRSGNHVLLTTPLTGWFACAGERGTGIAVLLDLVTRLVHERPLCVLATGGHELGYIGAEHWVANQLRASDRRSEDVGCIVHIGASAAVEATVLDGRQLIETRRATTSLNAERSRVIANSLRLIGLELATSSSTWHGEAESLCRLQVPMLSLTGAGAEFHTPDDRAEAVTSPASLARVADAFYEATVALRDGTVR
jgi:hypothetical protein